MTTTHRENTLGHRRGAHVRGATLTGADIQLWFGIPVTNIARTLVDLARHDRWDAIIAADAALHERVVDRATIDQASRTAAGWPGVRRAREVLALARAEAESPFESLLRIRLHDDGFPEPELQIEIPVPGRDVPYRVDALFRRQGIALEADGLAKYTAAELRREKRRDAALARVGVRVERVLWDDVVHDWRRTSRHLRSILSG